MMEIKPCPFCGCPGKVEASWDPHRVFFECTGCDCRTAPFKKGEDAADAWNQRFEQNPTEADRWLKEATEQRDRADRAEAERDELKESLAQATRMMKYAGKMQ